MCPPPPKIFTMPPKAPCIYRRIDNLFLFLSRFQSLMAFPGGISVSPDSQQLIKPSFTFTTEDLLISGTTSLTQTPQQDDFHLLPNFPTYTNFFTPKNNKSLVDRKYLWYRKLPYFTLIITISEILIHILFITKYRNLYNLFVFDPNKNNEIWRYVTYMLIHSDIYHLLMNITMQLVVAVPLEWYQANIRPAIIFMAGIIYGTLGTFIFQTDTKVIGASAGTYALLLSHCADCFLNRRRKNVIVQISAVCFIIFIDACYVIFHVYNNGNVYPKIGWSAHYSGAVNGFFLGFVIYKGAYAKSEQTTYIKALRGVCGIIWLTLLVTAITMNLLKMHI